MGVIKYQKKENMAFEILPNGVKRAEMLPGMVEGVHTYKCQVKAGETVELEVFGDITQLSILPVVNVISQPEIKHLW